MVEYTILSLAVIQRKECSKLNSRSSDLAQLCASQEGSTYVVYLGVRPVAQTHTATSHNLFYTPATMSTSKKDDLSSNITKLSIKSSQSSSKPAPSKKKRDEVADSWDDEAVSDSDPEDAAAEEADGSGQVTPKNAVPAPPPPTPMSPAYGAGGDWDSQMSPVPGSPHGDGSSRRPEKTDAVARRLIAAGLGLKAPKQTEEQKAYQKSVREQETKRREREKEEQQRKVQETAKAKAAVWDD